jgi:PadR family transcriptional regulator, regulatory protein PadR
MTVGKADILQGTLDLMVLKALDAMGPMHGYGLALRIEQISAEVLRINQGTIYLCLVRLVQQGWIRAQWGSSENNRRAKFYAITAAGRKVLRTEASTWRSYAAAVSAVLDAARPGTA